jgi:hypothetical protein
VCSHNKKNGILTRNKVSIRQKIVDLQSTYNKAPDWSEQTGAGILNSNLNEKEAVKSVHGRII